MNNLITRCYTCKSDQVVESTYEDYNDETNEEIVRQGVRCKECCTFNYEENDRIITVFDIQPAETINPCEGYLTKI